MSANKLKALLALVVAVAAALAAAWDSVKPELDAFLAEESPTVVVVPSDAGVAGGGASDDAGR